MLDVDIEIAASAVIRACRTQVSLPQAIRPAGASTGGVFAFEAGNAGVLYDDASAGAGMYW
jgi:hypothetical protein